MEAVDNAQAETNSVTAERKVISTLKRDIPPAADRTYEKGEEMLVYYEEE